MTTKSTVTINSIAAFLRSCARGGVWNNSEAYELGVPVAFKNGTPIGRLPLDEAEHRITAMPDDPDQLRSKIQLRFGFAPYSAWASQRRDSALDALYDSTPPERRGTAYRSPSVPRVETDELARAAARVIIRGAVPAPPPAYDYTRDLYLRSISLPPRNVGTATEVHRRVIRSNVEGLDRIVVHRSAHWNSSSEAPSDGLGATAVRSVRGHPDSRNGLAGERDDFEIRFPALNPGDRPRELGWMRTRKLSPGWLPPNGSMVFWSTPDRPTTLMVIEIKFGWDAMPDHVFRFSDVYEGDRLDLDIPFEVVPIVGGAVRCEWPNPAIGRTSGIRVIWPPTP